MVSAIFFLVFNQNHDTFTLKNKPKQNNVVLTLFTL